MSTIQTNNTDLQAILDTVQALPDKVEAATYETCTLYINCTYGAIERIIFIQNFESGIEIQDTFFATSSMELYPNVLCDSLIYFSVLSTATTIGTSNDKYEILFETSSYNSANGYYTIKGILKIIAQENETVTIAPISGGAG